MAKKKKHIDYFFLIVFSALMLTGLVLLAEVSAVRSQQVAGNSTLYLFHQFTHGILPGLLLGFVVFKIGLEKIRKASLFLVLGNLMLMFAVFIPGLGLRAGGASRWLDFRIFAFQPAEFLKLTTIIYLSAWLASRTGTKERKATFFPFFAVMGLITLSLYLQSDLSTWGVILASSLAVYFLSETPLFHSLIFFLAGTGLTALLVKFIGYRSTRLAVFLGSKVDPMGFGYHMKQALIAVGSGGIWGIGLGMSQQKYGFLPSPMADSIFAIYAEELGFAGCLLLIALLVMFFWRVFSIAKGKKDKFSQLCAMGIGVWICVQALINMGAMIRLLPLTGIPFPFVAFGGSHMIVEIVAASLVLKISKS